MRRTHEPRRLLDEPRRFLSKDQCQALATRAMGFATGGGNTSLFIDTWWSGEMRWGRNRVTLGSDRFIGQLYRRCPGDRRRRHGKAAYGAERSA